MLKKTGLVINDAWIDQNDNLLYLVNYQESYKSIKSEDFFWVSSKQLGAAKINEYNNQLQSSINNDIQNDIICNSSKLYTLPCNKKCRTVGIFLACYNCGIIASYKVIIFV